MSNYYIDKTQNTMADSLKASGFMRILAELYDKQLEYESPTMTIRDRGVVYEIVVDTPLDRERVRNVDLFIPAPFIQTVKNRDKLPEKVVDSPNAINYEKERDNRKRFYDVTFKQLPSTAKRAFARGGRDPELSEVLHLAPHQHWDLLRAINPAALTGYNGLLTQWHTVYEAGLLGDLCLLLLDLFSTSPNNLEAIVKQWKEVAKPNGWGDTATASQLFNPSQGKGINKLLPNGVGLGNLKNFWLIEFLKAVGMFEIGITRTMKGGGDRKTYIPAFGSMTRQMSKKVDRRFRTKLRFGETAIRSDIFMLIRYVRSFIEYIQTDDDTPDQFELLFGDDEAKTPDRFMHGFHTVFYKDLGNAVATMNISFLNVPNWIRVGSREDADAYLAVLEEHEQIIDQFEENKGEEIALLQAYRNFIAADHLDPFFEFTTLYSGYLIRQGERGGYPPKQLTNNNLWRVIVSNQPELSPILQSEGFRNIATAIRRSTISAQYRKKKLDDRRYSVRYGLGRDLMRRAQYKEDFLVALSEFTQSYNQENAQVLETRPGPYRTSITTDDLEEIVQLIDRYQSAEMIAKLLIAFGYAREPQSDQQEQEKTPNA